MLKTTKKILVLGGTGYLGQRIAHHLHQAGHDVRVMTRRPHMAKAWLPHAQIVTGDALSSDDLTPAMHDISHVIVCIRPKKDMSPKAHAALAMPILHTATRMGVTHLTWIAAESPSNILLKKVLRSYQDNLRLFLLQSAAIMGSGSLAETAQQNLKALPHWLFPTRRGQRMVAIDTLLKHLSRVLQDNKKGQLTLPEKMLTPLKIKKAKPQMWVSPSQNGTQISNRGGSLFLYVIRRLRLSLDLDVPRPGGEHPRKRGSATAHGATSLFWKGIRSRFHFGMGIWLLATRLPHTRGVWLYHHMAGTDSPIAFTPDTHITWQEALPERDNRTWTEIPCPISPKRQEWLKRQLHMAAPLKPGQYRHRCRLVHEHDQQQAWQTQMRYPFGIRIVIAQQVHVSLVPRGPLGWVLGKIARLFFEV
jgi:hypothetical protein